MTENRENHQHSCWTRTSKTAGNVDCAQVREPRLHPASEVDNAIGSDTRIAESQRSSWSAAEREVVSSQPSSTRVLKTWHSATTWDTEEPEDVSMLLPSWTCQGGWDTRVFGKRAQSPRRVEFFFFYVCFFVCLLTLLGTMCYSRKQWNRDTWRWSGPFSRCLSLTPASLKSIKEVRSSLRGSFFFFFFSFFGLMCLKRGTNKNYFS